MLTDYSKTSWRTCVTAVIAQVLGSKLEGAGADLTALIPPRHIQSLVSESRVLTEFEEEAVAPRCNSTDDMNLCAVAIDQFNIAEVVSRESQPLVFAGAPTEKSYTKQRLAVGPNPNPRNV